MAKKKDKPQVINNIGELNLEIDYDKLAEAIVKAQKSSESETSKNKKFTSVTFALLISLVFRGIAIIGFALTIIMPIALWESIKIKQEGILGLLFVILMGAFSLACVFVLFILSWILWKSAKEIETEKDRNYIISVFSGIVSFAALIVALVALFKGVG